MLDVPHGKGTIIFGNGYGGGIQRPERTDKYEGEFDTGFAHGLGQYTSSKKKKLYRGEYNIGQRHGCGAEYDMNPYLKRVQAGMNPDQAWQEAQPEIEKSVKYGTWLRDTFFTGPDDSGRYCHLNEIKGTLQEVESVVSKVKMFQYKPDGEVTLRFTQDKNGMPAPVMQDPLHFPHGTGFLAPGPMGQCHPIPDEAGLKEAMLRAAENHKRILDQYNLPYDVEPGSDMDKAQKMWKRKQARRAKALEKKLLREQQKIRRMEGAADDEDEEESTPPKGGALDEEFDEDDLIASVDGGASGSQQSEGSNNTNQQGFAPPSIMASMTLGLNRATAALQRAFHEASIRAPPRRSLTRPQRRQ